MAKPEWGVKRLCQSCATKFYDLGRSPIACPQCGARFDPEALLKSRRSRPTAASKPAKPPAKALKVEEKGRPNNELPDGSPDESPDESSVDPGGDDRTVKDVADDGDDASVIGNTSELGKDADLSDVVVTGADKDD
ncbi:MAG: TIGR02300 family protein [Gemmatimonadetes bacterium]|nr:TIGR02300 family protein [Gemmatimonadota bacterium]